MTDRVCFEVDDLRDLPDGTEIALRYKTHRSSYDREQSVEGTVTVVAQAVNIGTMYKVYTERYLAKHRSVGEVVHKNSTGWESVGIFHRGEVLSEV